MTASFYRHIVALKFKNSTTPEQIAGVERAFAALPDQIDTIRGFEWGTNVSPEGKSKGFTHCFLVTFEDPAGLETYLPHPAHKAFGLVLRPLAEDVLVVDFISS